MTITVFGSIIISALVTLTAGSDEPPVVAAVVNAASLVQSPAVGHALAPGSLATIFGQNLADSISIASPPYGALLGGTSVSVGSSMASLLYVSPTQLNIQLPSELPLPSVSPGYPSAQVPLVVHTAKGTSAVFMVDLYQYGFGIFTLDGSGCGRAAILNVKPDGSVSLNSPDNSASPGDYIEIFGTGLGVERPKLANGYPAPLNPIPIDTSSFSIAAPEIGGNDAITYAGWAPDLVGVDQVNVRIPEHSPGGCNVPLSVTVGDGSVSSQLVALSIHTGGGKCVDPPQTGSGQITFERLVFMDSSQPENDTVTASFWVGTDSSARSIDLGWPTAPEWSFVVRSRQDAAAACGTPGIRPIGVGRMTAQNNGPEIVATETSSNERLQYTANLPTGSTGPGTYVVTASGTGGIGPFQASLNTGQPIHPTVQLPQSNPASPPLPASAPVFTVTWTGGDSNETVRVKIVQHTAGGLTDLTVTSSAPAAAQIMQLGVGRPISSHGQMTYLPIFGSGPIEIDVDVISAAPVSGIDVPGLSGGVLANWVYEYRFFGVLP